MLRCVLDGVLDALDSVLHRVNRIVLSALNRVHDCVNRVVLCALDRMLHSLDRVHDGVHHVVEPFVWDGARVDGDSTNSLHDVRSDDRRSNDEDGGQWEGGLR